MVLQALPNLVNGFNGCSTQTECANKYIIDNNQSQYEMNTTLHSGGGGGKRKRGLRRRLSRYNKNKRGGDDSGTATQDYYSCEAPDPNVTRVVQFDNNGPDVSPLNSNSSSVDTNTTLIAGQNNSLNDCYATGTCVETPCAAAAASALPAQGGGGGTKRRKRTTKRVKSIKRKRTTRRNTIKTIKTKRKNNKKKKNTRRN
jgi:hypothetical protein